jgi:hypothetical protein
MTAHQTAIDATRSSLMLNANLPVGTAGVPGSQLSALNNSAMKLKLTSTASTSTTSGTEITGGSGYTTGGTAFSGTPTTSTSGADVLIPFAIISWQNTSTAWSIVSLEINDGLGGRVWYGNWTGQPIGVATGNTFSVAVGAIAAGGF